MKEIKKQSSNEWYTPSRYIEAAREVFGGSIDLDPASCELANRTVKATHYYSKEDDGLSKEWYGNVWLNPPFGRTENNYQSNIGLFTQKLINEYREGNVAQAILLSTSRTDTSWFHQLWHYPICFTGSKVGFYRPDKNKIRQIYSHTHGTIFVYLGSHEQRFIEVFQQFGTIARRVNVPARIETPVPSLWEGVA